MNPSVTPARSALRFALAWAALSWLLLAIANLLFPAIALPSSAVRWLLAGLLLLTPFVVLAGWRHGSKLHAARIDQATVVLVLGALSLSLLHQFIAPFAPRNEPAAAVDKGSVSPPAPLLPTLPIDPHSIAVLPFANLSPEPGDAYFAEGLAEEILNVLARVRGLKVTSRTSSFQFRDPSLGAGTIALRLGVAHLLEGSVRRQGDTVRISAQLVDASSERQLWSQVYERQLSDIFQVQQEIAQAIVDALATSLGVRTVEVAPSTSDLQAYEEYLRGRQLFVQRGASLPAARELLEHAVERDPRFVDAWAALAGTWYVWRAYSAEPPGIDTLERAETTAARALALNPRHAAALAVNARLAADRGDRLREAELIGQALALEPNNANTWLWKGLGQYEAGHVAAAQASFVQAQRLDPLSGLHLGWVAITRPATHDDAEALLLRAHALGWRGPASRALLLAALAAGTDPSETYLAWLHDDETLTPVQRDLLRKLAPALTDRSQREAAHADLRAAVDEHPTLEWAVPLQVFGLTEAAMTAALDQRAADAQTLRLTLWHPAFRSLRSEPRFMMLAEREGLLAYWDTYGAPDGCRFESQPSTLICDP